MSDDSKKVPPKAEVIDPNIDGEWKAPSQSLDTDGRVVGQRPPPRAEPAAPRAAVQPHASGRPHLSALATGDLELVRSKEQRVYDEPEPYREEAPAAPRRRTAAVAVVLGLVLAGLGGLVLFWKSPRLAATVNAGAPKGVLLVSSTPSGAELWLGGNKVGSTPWAADNRFVGKTTYEVRAKGYKTARGTFEGGVETRLEVELEAE